MEKLPISAVICTLNSENSIRECLAALYSSGLEQIIVVDGGSKDRTIDVVNEFSCEVLRDNGDGLGAARNLGMTVATQPFLMNCGSDNVLHRELIESMLTKLEGSRKILAVGCRTKVQGENYLSKALNLQWEGRIRAGNEDVLGTPNLFRTKLIKEFKYSNTRSFSDDEDLCTRMREKYEGEFIVLPDFCLEIGQADIKTLQRRFDYYGKSDFEIFSAYSAKWSGLRKIKSLLHPLNVELVDIARVLPLHKFLFAAPFLAWATTIRYRGWAKTWLKESRN